MPTATYTFPDGRRKATITFETQAQLNEAIMALESREPEKRLIPTSFKELGQDIMGIPRQVGLTARYGLEAFGQTALPDLIGLPQPENPMERVVGTASRNLIGAGAMATGAGPVSRVASPVVSGIGRSMAANQAAQAGGAIGAGVGSQSVVEAGGGPVMEFVGALLGGGAGAASAGGLARAASWAGAKWAQATDPKQVTATVETALRQAGVDWDSLSNSAKESLTRDATQAVYSGQPLNAAAIRRLADFRNVGATPLVGDITQDPRTLTNQRNLAKTQANIGSVIGPDLAGIQNQNARTVISTLENVERSPLDATGAGQRIIGGIVDQDAAMKSAETALYRTARDAAGRDIPLNRAQFVNQAFDNLAKSNKGAFLPAEVETLLNQISVGQIEKGGQTYAVPFTVDTIDALKTTLASASRSARDGNVKAAIAAVRDALENTQPGTLDSGVTVPVTGQQAAALRQAGQAPAEALSAFDKARAAARSRRAWQESATFIEDALAEGADPEKFVKKHIVGAELGELKKLRTAIASDPESVAAVRRQLLDHIRQRGRVDGDVVNYSSAGMRDALNQIGPHRLAVFFTGEEMGQIRSAINVARYGQAQPIGSAVNNSNTAAMAIGRIFDGMLKGSAGMPFVGPWVSQPLIGATTGIQARQLARVPNALIAPPQGLQPVPVNALAAFAIAPSGNENRRNKPSR